MFSASLYIIACTAKNRLLVRLRRLREPRYLVGAIVGVAYLYFSVFARWRSSSAGAARRRARNAQGAIDAFAVLSSVGPALIGLGLMVVTALAWILPFESGLLNFSQSEIQFLFTAPVSRRSLLLHRLLRSQIGILFGSLMAVLVAPSLPGRSRLQISVGVWLLLCTGKVFFTGVSLARARLGSADARAKRVARLPIAVMVAALAVVGGSLYRAVEATPVAGPRDLIERIASVSSGGLPRVVMFPFMSLARPMFAEWPGGFLLSLVMAALVLAATTAWVLQSDATFEAATEEAARVKESSARGAKAKYRARASGWTLATTGRPEMIFAWKCAMQTFRIVDVRVLFRVVAMLFALSVVGASVGQRNGLVAALAMFAMTGAAFSLLLAPQALRMDLRQDLQHLELMKMWPLRASDVVRGEMIWPGAIITGLAWTLIALATILSGSLFTRFGASQRISLGLAAAILAPGLAFAQLAIHNGMALLFPAWVSLGNQRSRGLDALGQRIITLAGTWLALIVLALPGAIAGFIIWFAFQIFVGSAALIPAAMVCCAALLMEVLVLTEMLGPAYERLDLTAVEPAE
jgi:ABC-2 type transport system permease protein